MYTDVDGVEVWSLYSEGGTFWCASEDLESSQSKFLNEFVNGVRASVQAGAAVYIVATLVRYKIYVASSSIIQEASYTMDRPTRRHSLPSLSFAMRYIPHGILNISPLKLEMSSDFSYHKTFPSRK